MAKLWRETQTAFSIFQDYFPSSTGGLNAFYWYQIFALDSAVVEVQEMFSSQTCQYHLHRNPPPPPKKKKKKKKTMMKVSVYLEITKK